MKRIIILIVCALYPIFIDGQCKRGKQFLLGIEGGVKGSLGNTFLLNSTIKADKNISKKWFGLSRNWGFQVAVTYIGKVPKHSMLGFYAEFSNTTFKHHYYNIKYSENISSTYNKNPSYNTADKVFVFRYIKFIGSYDSNMLYFDTGIKLSYLK